MLLTIPQKVLDMKDKRDIIQENKRKYAKAPKKLKSTMIDQMQIITNYSRKHIIRLLCNSITPSPATHTNKRGRKKIYPQELGKILLTIWKISGQISSFHLHAFIHENMDTILQWDELKNTSPKDMELIAKMSPATMERILKPYRDKHKEDTASPFDIKKKKGESIAIQSSWQRPKNYSPGYLEIDLVEHSGGNHSGDFLYTLTAVDVDTYWIFLRSLKNKAEKWTREAIDNILQTSPFSIYHIHTDNGSEFINWHLKRLLKHKKVEFTRSRPHRSNDNPHVENRNMVAVREYLGYQRYDSIKEQEIIKRLLSLIELRHNFFIPVMKPTSVEVVAEGKKRSRLRKRYVAKSPYKRLMESSDVSLDVKERLKEFRESLDFREINRQIVECWKDLQRVHSEKRRKSNGKPASFGDI